MSKEKQEIIFYLFIPLPLIPPLLPPPTFGCCISP